MPSTIGKSKLFRIKPITLLEGDTFLRNKHEIAFLEIKCIFFGRKENTISEPTFQLQFCFCCYFLNIFALLLLLNKNIIFHVIFSFLKNLYQLNLFKLCWKLLQTPL